jgi:hypothetical protein
MDRRDFLKQVMLWSAGISTAIPSFRIGSELLAAEKASPLLSHVTGKNYHELVARVLEPLGGIGKFVKTGDNVVIKPNMNPLMQVQKRSWYSTGPATRNDDVM